MIIFAVYPQYNLLQLRGADYEKAFASCDLDEMAYASYLQALIDGRPRKNDPYTGRDDVANAPQPESLFSIQFFPAYLVAIPARILGVSASEIMPFVSACAAFLTALALFWLIFSLTENALFAAVGTLIILVGSALIMGIGALNGFYETGVAYPYFPFLRRYIPSLGFPFLFAFLACLWNGLKSESHTKRIIYSISASCCFAALVFSYFYLWTSAGAILFGWTAFVLIFHAENRWKNFRFLLTTGIACVFALMPYAFLLAHRDETMDKAQLLVFTRQPDLLRTPEVIGYFVLTLTVLALWQKFTKLEENKAFFVAACAFSPFLVFNQQILSGRSLQPFHYEFYVINYVILLSIVLLVAIFWQQIFIKLKSVSIILLLFFGTAAIGWGYVEATKTTEFWDDINIQRDEAMPVNFHLRQIADEARKNGENPLLQTTLNLNQIQSDSQPTVAPQSILWARHQHVFAGLKSWDENKERYYQLLYYADLDEKWLRTALNGCSDIEACMALVGWDRFNPRLSANSRPLTQPEVEEEIQLYADFRRNFSRENAQRPTLSFVVVHSEAGNEFKNLDKWYERDAGENYGKYILYRVKLRN